MPAIGVAMAQHSPEAHFSDDGLKSSLERGINKRSMDISNTLATEIKPSTNPLQPGE
jgi:hypothetical protein